MEICSAYEQLHNNHDTGTARYSVLYDFAPDLVWHCPQLSCWHISWYIVHPLFYPYHLPLLTKSLNTVLPSGSYFSFTKASKSLNPTTAFFSAPIGDTHKATIKVAEMPAPILVVAKFCYNLTLSVVWWLPQQALVYTASSIEYQKVLVKWPLMAMTWLIPYHHNRSISIFPTFW